MFNLNRFAAVITVMVTAFANIAPSCIADEGMFPMSELKQLNLAGRGIQLTADQLFNPNEISLVDGICRVNGCTGSFISNEGLIITNHHCAYDAIQQASRADRDLLGNGFQAKTRGEEIPAPGYVVRITEDYKDVSKEVLEVVGPGMDFLARTKAIQKRSRELERQAEVEHPGLRAEVAEMFTGKTYVMFLYTFLRDVRLVFAPPAAVGNFGGEDDNWEWPRHTGDFSLMRAYTAPDGSSAAYSDKNVPYKPKRVVKVNPRGANEGDTVFLLGYPGRTARHKTASFLKYEQKVRLPITVDLYAWQIDQMTKAGANDRAVELKMTAKIKSLANVEKRSRGQLLGLRRTDIISSREAQEQQLQQYIDAEPARKQRYGQALTQIATVYTELEQKYPFEFCLEQLRSAPRTTAAAYFLVDAANERAKPDVERELPYADKNIEQTTQNIRNGLRDFHAPTEKILLRGLVERLKAYPESTSIPALAQLIANPEKIDQFVDATQLASEGNLDKLVKLDLASLNSQADPMIVLMKQLYSTYTTHRDLNKQRDGRLNELYGLLLEIKPEFLKSSFVPDANGTLRLTSGKIRAYSPVDGIVKTPVSTFRGVVEKTTGKDPFITPDAVMEKWKAKQFDDYMHPTLKDIPVAILYDTDTTGGNSGSPIFNSKGELVGVNFDRCFEATINDFAWNTNYSRSIGVDIRYVLWIVSTVYGADHLRKEVMGADAK